MSFCFTALWAQHSIYQSNEISNLISEYRTYQQVIDVEDGYRIQITYTSNRDEVYKAKAKLYQELEDVPAYVEYEQPNYKLRVGDFKTKLQATEFLQKVILFYPGAFIVKDRIKKS